MSLATNDKVILNETKNFLSIHFEMKYIGEIAFVLDKKIRRDKTIDVFLVSQRTHIEKYEMENCSLVSSPISKGDNLSLKDCPQNDL
ncbi:hypothetical protein QML37_29720, partial [Klebsiella pneumoniae]|uniref:hypothetical protein n=1 Tax=Klebsiella pneumoniae TaxID=573 RepID=UPI003A80A982